jgi:hypothetical protein
MIEPTRHAVLTGDPEWVSEHPEGQQCVVSTHTGAFTGHTATVTRDGHPVLTADAVSLAILNEHLRAAHHDLLHRAARDAEQQGIGETSDAKDDLADLVRRFADDPDLCEPPTDVRATGFRAMLAAAEDTTDLGQIYGRTLDAIWPHAVATAHTIIRSTDPTLDAFGEAVAQMINADLPPNALAQAFAAVQASERRLSDAERALNTHAPDTMEDYLQLRRAVHIAVAWLAADYTEVCTAAEPNTVTRAMSDRAARALYERLTRDAGSEEESVIAAAHEQRRAARRARSEVSGG